MVVVSALLAIQLVARIMLCYVLACFHYGVNVCFYIVVPAKVCRRALV
jgi:hypothetical protein